MYSTYVDTFYLLFLRHVISFARHFTHTNWCTVFIHVLILLEVLLNRNSSYYEFKERSALIWEWITVSPSWPQISASVVTFMFHLQQLCLLLLFMVCQVISSPFVFFSLGFLIYLVRVEFVILLLFLQGLNYLLHLSVGWMKGNLPSNSIRFLYRPDFKTLCSTWRNLMCENTFSSALDRILRLWEQNRQHFTRMEVRLEGNSTTVSTYSLFYKIVRAVSPKKIAFT